VIVTYFRSSSYNSWDFCAHKYFLSYVLGLPDRPHNNKADMGNAVHKALELLARKKLAEQEGEPTFTEDETGTEFDTASFSVEDAIEAAWAYIKKKAPHWEWNTADYRRHRKLTFAALEWDNGMFNPLNRTVLCPEQKFDFVIDQPWAHYDYELPDGKRLQGQLAMKGTVDLVLSVDGMPDVVEYCDWKTGARMDWSTGKKKDYQKLRNDPQLRMYHWALSKLYPNARSIIITIFFVADGGPYSLPFNQEDLAKTEAMLKRRFEVIRECDNPRRIKPDRKCSWCWYDKTIYGDTNQTVCDHIKQELVHIGINRVTEKYGNASAYLHYGEGGGRSAKPNEETPA